MFGDRWYDVSQVKCVWKLKPVIDIMFEFRSRKSRMMKMMFDVVLDVLDVLDFDS